MLAYMYVKSRRLCIQDMMKELFISPFGELLSQFSKQLIGGTFAHANDFISGVKANINYPQMVRYKLHIKRW